jgi:hypothetical protein
VFIDITDDTVGLFVLDKNCHFMTNHNNLGKRVKIKTIFTNTTYSFIPLDSNIQFSTNTEKEQI